MSRPLKSLTFLERSATPADSMLKRYKRKNHGGYNLFRIDHLAKIENPINSERIFFTLGLSTNEFCFIYFYKKI
jgi:hypothetical protein